MAIIPITSWGVKSENHPISEQNMTKPLSIDATCGGYPLQAQKSLILKRFTKRTLQGKNLSWFYRNDTFPSKHIRYIGASSTEQEQGKEPSIHRPNGTHSHCIFGWKAKTIPSMKKMWQNRCLSMPLVGGTLCKPKNLWFWSVLHKELYKEKTYHDFIEMIHFLQNIYDI